jgi:predicted nuclease with TOPRIM domain
MKNSIPIVIVLLACIGLAIALALVKNQAATQKANADVSIGNLSNDLVKTSDKLEEQVHVNTKLNTLLDASAKDLAGLTNKIVEVSTTLSKTEESLKAAQDEVAKRDARIAELEAQNQALDQRAADLSNAITNLTSQIDDTKKKLAASEGDKAFLKKELQRLMAEKVELERQFNDLAVLRAQVAKLKEKLAIARRLDWIRRGVFASSDEKGAERLMQKPAAPPAAAQPSRPSNYDLNVEVKADGTVRVIPPLTNNPTATNPPPK